MIIRRRTLIKLLLTMICLGAIVFAGRPGAAGYVWTEVTGAAAYPPGYNYPVFAIDGEMRALNGGSRACGDRLFITGGKYSFRENGEIKFVYSSDVWAMSRKTK